MKIMKKSVSSWGLLVYTLNAAFALVAQEMDGGRQYGD